MDDTLARELEAEIRTYKDRKEYEECVRRMEEREKEANDPEYRTIVLTAKSNCAANLGDWAMAETAINSIDITPLSPEMRNRVNLVRAIVVRHLGQPEQAESLFLGILTSEEARAEKKSEIIYEAAARLGIAYSHQNRFRAALDLLQKAEFMIPDGDFRDDIGICLAYCLQGLGRFEEAEHAVRRVLEYGSEEARADAYYRLGAIQLQAGFCEAAIDSFEHALSSSPHCGIAESDIVAALEEAKEEQRHSPVDKPPSKNLNKPRVQ